MAGFFTIKNFERFQHYKDRDPPWIKLYYGLLIDYEFAKLSDQAKAHLLQLGLLASRQPDHKIPYDAEWVSKKINATCPVDLDDLIARGWIILQPDASKVLAKCYQDARPETETETETETELDSPAWLPKEAFDGYQEMRKRIKAPMTERAKRLALANLERLKDQGHDPEAVLDQSTLNNWKGLFPLKDETNGRSKTNRPSAHETFAAASLSIIREARSRTGERRGDTGGAE